MYKNKLIKIFGNPKRLLHIFNMKKCGIYKITSPSGKIYIGQSKDIDKRWNFYYRNKNCKKQTYLYHSLKKYGWDNHVFEILEECTINLLNERERYW